MTGSPEPEKEALQTIVSLAPKPLSTLPSTGRDTVCGFICRHDRSGSFAAFELTISCPRPAMPAHASTKPAVEMKQTQPLIDLPAVEMPVTKMTIAPPSSHPAPQMQIDDIPTPFYWALLATSAAILILQIWNYLS
jgi:hypothetical protein